MWLESADIQHERPVLIILYELRRLVSQVRSHLVFFRQVIVHVRTERADSIPHSIRLIALFDKILIVARHHETLFGLGESVTVLRGPPNVEAVLRHQVVAQVPLAHVPLDVVVGNHFRDDGRVFG